MRDAIEGLWPENAEAWRIFQQVVTRFTVDLHAGNEVLRRATAHVDDVEEFGALMDRLSLIYELVYPPPTPSTSGA